MLEVCRPQTQDFQKIEKEPDIIITKVSKKIEYDKDLNRVEKIVKKKVNVTKLVNETKKVIKQQTAEEKLRELEKIVTK